MPNFFLTDANGQKHQINEQQLQALAAKGKIQPTTPLETDDGHRRVAGQVPGLNFNTAPPPFTQTAQATLPPPNVGREYKSIAWFDLSFWDVRLPKNIHSVCRTFYLCAWVNGIISGLWGSFCIIDSSSTITPFNLFAFIFLWLSIALAIFLVRIACEWQIVLMDYINQRSRREQQ